MELTATDNEIRSSRLLEEIDVGNMDELLSIVTLEFISTDDKLCLARLLVTTADSDTTWAENEVLSVARLAVNQEKIMEEPTSATDDDSKTEDTNGNKNTVRFLWRSKFKKQRKGARTEKWREILGKASKAAPEPLRSVFRNAASPSLLIFRFSL